MNKILTGFGIISTVIYSYLMYLLVEDRLEKLTTMDLNELGDFFAGVFGPLAIFWLILGFLQQGKELKQNTQALELQAKELRKSVEQQTELVNVTRQQHAVELEAIGFEREKESFAAKPIFIFGTINGSGREGHYTFKSKIVNKGKPATHISIRTIGEIESFSPDHIVNWDHDQEFQINWRYKTPKPENIAVLRINYTDSIGKKGEAIFELSPILDEELITVGIKEIITYAPIIEVTN